MLTSCEDGAFRWSGISRGVGRNFQDHPRIDCVWECSAPIEPCNNGAEVTVFWHSDSQSEEPDLQICVGEFPMASTENVARFGLPAHGWTMCAGILRPRSRVASA